MVPQGLLQVPDHKPVSRSQVLLEKIFATKRTKGAAKSWNALIVTVFGSSFSFVPFVTFVAIQFFGLA